MKKRWTWGDVGMGLLWLVILAAAAVAGWRQLIVVYGWGDILGLE